MTYLNIKTSFGIETVDELERKDFNTYKDFLTELKFLKNQYRMVGNSFSTIYTSQRCTNEWKNKNNL